MKWVAVCLVLIVFASGCTSQMQTESPKKTSGEEIVLNTPDGFELHGTYYRSGKNGIILLHMLGRDRTTWDGFAETLQNNGYSVLSIDFRGHGQSTTQNGQTRVWTGFSEQDFNNMVMDVEEADKFLRENGIEKISIIGASIGANIALKYAASRNIDRLVLLSPGVNYRGVYIGDIEYSGPVLVVASEGDVPAMNGLNSISEKAPNSQKKIYPGYLHGTNLLGTTDIESVILEFLSS